MKVAKNHVVSVSYKLSTPEGELLDQATAEEPLFYLHGSGNLLPKVEEQLDGLGKTESVSFTVEPKDGYGERLENGLHEVDKGMFPPEMPLQKGLPLVLESDEGVRQAFIHDVKVDCVVIDLNHPLSGQTLCFEFTVLDVRAASEEEVSHGHVHGPGGHHHH